MNFKFDQPQPEVSESGVALILERIMFHLFSEIPGQFHVKPMSRPSCIILK